MERISFYDQMSKNKRNSILLSFLVFFLLFSLISLFGFILDQIYFPGAFIFVFVFAAFIIIIYTWSSYTYGDQIVLKATNAKEVEEGDRNYIHLNDAVEGLSIAAGIPKPKVYVIESDEINAFATGKDPAHASVAVTTGLLKNLKRDEIEGVIGHELSHIRNYDIRFATIVAVMVGLAAILSNILLRSFLYGGFRSRDERGKGGAVIIVIIIVAAILAVIAPIVTRLVQAAISRKREYLADAASVELNRYPDGLANALEKIKNMNQGNMKVSEAVSHLFFTDPNRSFADQIFAIHPPIEDRIRILRSM